MQPASLGSQPLGDAAQEGDHIVLRLALDLAGPLRVDVLVGNCGTDSLPVVGRNDPALVKRLGGQQLDPEPELQSTPLPEKLAQLRQGVTVDHRARIRGCPGPRRAPA